MASLSGVFKTTKSDSSIYYRASITYQNKHVSLGSYTNEADANQAYLDAKTIISNTRHTITNYHDFGFILPFDKYVSIINFRDNNIYCKTPIYLSKDFFTYYLSDNIQLLFDVNDLFYYSNHKIMKRGNHLFVSDYGMQINILSRYGIRNYAIAGRDYKFVNGNPYDLRYSNIQIINKYYGVSKTTKNNSTYYITKIHVKGDLIVGRYTSEIEAAIAYNKASDYLRKNGIRKEFPQNYILEISSSEYLQLYKEIKIRKKVKNYKIV